MNRRNHRAHSKERLLKTLSSAVQSGIKSTKDKQSFREWTEDNICLSAKDANLSGQYKFSRVPYLIGIADTLDDPSVRKVVITKSAQLGATVFSLSYAMYLSFIYPSNLILVYPDEANFHEIVKGKLFPLLDSSPKISSAFGGGSGVKRNLSDMQFGSGRLKFVSVASRSGLRSSANRYIIGDELSSWPNSIDGDPVHLVEARAKTFNDRKILYLSTPAFTTTCKITREYEKGDQCKYNLPCPHCGDYIVLEFDGLRMQGKKTYYQCPICETLIDERHKMDMMRNGKWIPTNDKPMTGVKSYQIGGLLSPHQSWSDILEEYHNLSENGDHRAFYNNTLGVPYDNVSHEINKEDLRMSAEKAPTDEEGWRQLNIDRYVLGIDCQIDHFRAAAVGIIPLENDNVDFYLLDYQIVKSGDTSILKNWDYLKDFITTYKIMGRRPVKCVIDSAFNPRQAHLFVFQRNYRNNGRFCLAILGDEKITQNGNFTKPSLDVFKRYKTLPDYATRFCMKVPIAVFKSLIFDSLNNFIRDNNENIGKFRIPTKFYHGGLPYEKGKDVFHELTAEKEILEQDWRGKYKSKWVKKSDDNHCLDCAVYALSILTDFRYSNTIEFNKTRRIENIDKQVEDAVKAEIGNRRG